MRAGSFPIASILLLRLFAFAFASAQEVVQIDAANPPFMYVTDTGMPGGLYCELILEAFKRMDVPVVVRAVPWKRALYDADAGAAGIGGVYSNSERLQKYDYSDALFEERIVVYVPKGKDFRLTSIADLYGKKINVMAGWSYGDEFDEAVKAGLITVDEVSGDEKTLFLLAAGRNDATLSVLESGEATVRKLGYADRLTRLPEVLIVNKTYLAFGKKAEKIGLIEGFNKAIADMRGDGTFDQIVKDSMGIDESLHETRN